MESELDLESLRNKLAENQLYHQKINEEIIKLNDLVVLEEKKIASTHIENEIRVLKNQIESVEEKMDYKTNIVKKHENHKKELLNSICSDKGLTSSSQNCLSISIFKLFYCFFFFLKAMLDKILKNFIDEAVENKLLLGKINIVHLQITELKNQITEKDQNSMAAQTEYDYNLSKLINEYEEKINFLQTQLFEKESDIKISIKMDYIYG